MKRVLFLLLLLPGIVKAQLVSFAPVLVPTLTPLLSATPTTISDTTVTGTQSVSKMTTLSWNNLGANAITIPAPTGWVVSLNNSSFAGSQAISNPGASGTQNIYYALPSSNSPGTYNTTSIIACTGLGLTAPITLNGLVTGVPTLSASPGTLPFTSVVGTQGPADSTTIAGSNLGTNNVSVTIPTGYVGGLTIGGMSGSSPVTITPSAGSVSQKFYYALNSSVTSGTNNGTSNITCPGSGVSGTSVTLNGTTSATSATLFAFSRTSRPLPTISGVVIQAMVGDPSVATVTATANGITCTSGLPGSTNGAWQATGSPLTASNDSLGNTGSAMPGGGCPDSILNRGWFSISSSNRLADSVNQSLLKPNLSFSGMTVGHTYTVTVYSSINPRYSGFHNTVHATAVGSTTQASAALALLSNKSTPITFTIQPNSSGILNLYFFTDGAATSAINAVNAVNIAP